MARDRDSVIKIPQFDDRHFVAALTVAVAGVALWFAVTSPILATDTCCRHAPMAEAFAAGNWANSFHPRFCLGMPVVSGIVCRLTGLDGYVSCSVVATLAWVLVIPFLFSLAKDIFGRTTAWMVVALYVVCPQIILWSLKGLREPFKVLGLVLAADALYRCRAGGWRSFAEASVGLLLLSVFKVDGVAVGAIFAVAYAIGDRFRGRGVALLLQMIAWWCLNSWFLYSWSGYFLPAPNYMGVWDRLIGVFG